jgi:prepilin-type N-terminal cleavage/methylation domain-containing protein
MTRKHQHAFTLLELLFALAIILALVAITVPVTTQVLERRRFESSVDQVTQQLLLARSRAEAEGRPVEVVYLGPLREIRARWFDPESLSEEGAAEPPEVVGSSWASRVLPGDVRLTNVDPTADALPGRSFEPYLEPRNASSFRVAVFMPDGSALMTPRTWLTDDDDRVGSIRINAFTGLPSYERLSTDEASPDEDEPEETEPEPGPEAEPENET